jgi:hypothetical protein
MASKLRDAARQADDEVPEREVLTGMIRRWEHGAGVSERYRLHLCRVFGIEPDQYGTVEPAPPAPAPAGPPAEPGALVTSHPAPIVPHVWSVITPPLPVVYRGVQEPDSWIMREVLVAVTDSSEHAEQSEQREIGDVTLEQFRADVIRLSGAYMTGEPLALLIEMRGLRERMHAALDRRIWPRDQADVYLLLGCLTDLTASVVKVLGYGQAAEDLLRSAWAYAMVIDHKPLMAHLRLQLSTVCFWNDQPQRARDFAADGLRYLADGQTAAHLHLMYARAAARMGDADDARQAVPAAADARQRGNADDVTELGGEFALSRATQHQVAGSALAELDAALDDAARELDEAARLYGLGPGPDEQHWFAGQAQADISRATVRLRTGALDGAAAVLDPVLSLPRGQRIAAVTISLGQVRKELAAPVYRGSAQARELGDRIEEFCRETVVTDLHSLPGG